MNFVAGLVELNTLLNDGDNFTFTTDQKTQALTNAWNDSDVVRPVWDGSVIFSVNSYQYAIPASMTMVKDIYLERYTGAFPEPIGNELWEVVAGNIQFLHNAHLVIPDSYQLWIKGGYKLTTNDSLDTVALQNYVVSKAAYLTLRQLAYMKGLRFLRNDTTMADIVNLRNQMREDMQMWRLQLQREFQAA